MISMLSSSCRGSKNRSSKPPSRTQQTWTESSSRIKRQFVTKNIWTKTGDVSTIYDHSRQSLNKFQTMAGTFESTNSRKRRKLSSLTNFRFRRKIFIKRLNNAVTAAKSVLSLISKCIYKVFYVCHHIPGPCQPTEEKQCVRLITIKSEIFLIISKLTACLVV